MKRLRLTTNNIGEYSSHVVDIAADAFGNYGMEEDTSNHMIEAEDGFVYVTIFNKVVGFILTNTLTFDSRDCLHLSGIAIHPNFHGTGLAKEMLADSLDETKSTLDVKSLDILANTRNPKVIGLIGKVHGGALIAPRIVDESAPKSLQANWRQAMKEDVSIYETPNASYLYQPNRYSGGLYGPTHDPGNGLKDFFEDKAFEIGQEDSLCVLSIDDANNSERKIA
jgi:GNAT superfamily N-acetyltransferase